MEHATVVALSQLGAEEAIPQNNEGMGHATSGHLQYIDHLADRATRALLALAAWSCRSLAYQTIAEIA